MPLNIPNDIVADADVDAAPLQANFNAIESHVNTEVIARNGSVAMTAGLSLTAPTADAHAVRRTDLWKRAGEAAYDETGNGTQNNFNVSTGLGRQVTDISAPFTADATVKYKVTFCIPWLELVSGAGWARVAVSKDGGATALAEVGRYFHADSNTDPVYVIRRLAAGVLSGATTLTAWVKSDTGQTLQLIADVPAQRPYILVEPLGV